MSEETRTTLELAAGLDSDMIGLAGMLKTLTSFIQGCVDGGIDQEDVPGLAYMLELITQHAERIRDDADELHADMVNPGPEGEVPHG